MAAANRAQDGPDALVDDAVFEALEAAAEFDRVLFDGGEFGRQAAVGSAEEEDFLGMPGLLEPDQVAALLRQRQSDQLAARPGRSGRGAAEEKAAHREVGELRKELSSLVAAYRHASGRGHASIHADLRRATGGPPAAQADAAELSRRIETLRRWAVGRR